MNFIDDESVPDPILLRKDLEHMENRVIPEIKIPKSKYLLNLKTKQPVSNYKDERNQILLMLDKKLSFMERIRSLWGKQ